MPNSGATAQHKAMYFATPGLTTPTRSWAVRSSTSRRSPWTGSSAPWWGWPTSGTSPTSSPCTAASRGTWPTSGEATRENDLSPSLSLLFVVLQVLNCIWFFNPFHPDCKMFFFYFSKMFRYNFQFSRPKPGCHIRFTSCSIWRTIKA